MRSRRAPGPIATRQMAFPVIASASRRVSLGSTNTIAITYLHVSRETFFVWNFQHPRLDCRASPDMDVGSGLAATRAGPWDQRDGWMARTVAIANQKGGVGKTTTAVNLAAALALRKKTVLLIDLDPQGNAGSGLGFANLKHSNRGIYEVLTGGLAAEKAIVDAGIPGLGLIPSGQRLAGAEVELVDAQRREYRLKDAL